jgi:GNAT superfamily N-acetyltransferase
MTIPIVTRRAGPADLDAMLDNYTAGVASYAAFAPAGWQPHDVDRHFEAEVLADVATWALLALVAGDPVGHASFIPARERTAGEHWQAARTRPPVPGLAHLRQLFVLPDWWGRGVAPVLHDGAVGEMRAQGYDHARLFTPAAHARARRFYERRGWITVTEAWNEDFGLSLAEYRLSLDG